MKNLQNYPPHFYLDKIKISVILTFFVMLYSSNIVKAQNAIGNSTSPYGGWLFHTHSITIGSEIQPQNTLHINKKTSTGINYIQITNEAGGSGIFTGKSSTDGFLIGLDGIGYEKLGISINQQERSYIRFLTTNTERMRISQDGFVGIGTILPDTKLHLVGYFKYVNGNEGINKILFSDANGLANWQSLNLNLNSNTLSLNSFSSVDLSLYLDNTDEQNLSLSGTSLNISGGTGVNLSAFMDNTDNQSLSISGHELTLSNGGTITIPDNIDDADADPNNEIQDLSLSGNILSLTNDATSVDLSTYLPLTETQVDDYVDNNGYLITEIDGDITNELITSASLNGTNLEISDAGGTKIVDLSSLDNSAINIDDADADPTNELQELNLSGNVLSLSNNNSNVDLSNINYWAKTNNDVYYNSGKVGIGISTPTSNLHLHNAGTSSQNNINPFSNKINGHGGNPVSIPIVTSFQLTTANSGTSENDGLFIQIANYQATINFKEAGYLNLLAGNKGIRIKNNTGALKFDNLVGQGNRLLVADAQGNISGIATNSFTIWKKNGEKIYYNDEFVGIGTDNPHEKLEVNGNIKIGQNTLIFKDVNHGIAYKEEFAGKDIGGPVVYGWSGGALGTMQNGTEKNILVWKENGRVGIGTDNPTQALSVKGKIVSQENIVVADVNNYTYPDYVFADDYKPISLNDLEKFITENNHLPEIPTTKQIAKEGIKLGEMNIKLLKKVEELTLYTIEQEKAINNQQKLIEKLMIRIDKLEKEK